MDSRVSGRSRNSLLLGSSTPSWTKYVSAARPLGEVTYMRKQDSVRAAAVGSHQSSARSLGTSCDARASMPPTKQPRCSVLWQSPVSSPPSPRVPSLATYVRLPDLHNSPRRMSPIALLHNDSDRLPTALP